MARARRRSRTRSRGRSPRADTPWRCRAREQGGLGEAGARPDRLEREDDAFFEAIGAAYEQLAQAEPQRIRSIDASQAPDEVLRDAIAAIEDLVAASSAEPHG